MLRMGAWCHASLVGDGEKQSINKYKILLHENVLENFCKIFKTDVQAAIGVYIHEVSV